MKTSGTCKYEFTFLTLFLVSEYYAILDFYFEVLCCIWLLEMTFFIFTFNLLNSTCSSCYKKVRFLHRNSKSNTFFLLSVLRNKLYWIYNLISTLMPGKRNIQSVTIICIFYLILEEYLVIILLTKFWKYIQCLGTLAQFYWKLITCLFCEITEVLECFCHKGTKWEKAELIYFILKVLISCL